MFVSFENIEDFVFGYGLPARADWAAGLRIAAPDARGSGNNREIFLR